METVREYAITRKSAARSKRVRSEAVAGYLFTLPVILGLLLWTIGPMMASLVISFTNWQVFDVLRWVGIRNYDKIFTSDLFFYKSILVTLYYAFGSVVTTSIASILLGTLMNLGLKRIAILRTILYMPTIVPAVASSFLWIWLFNPDFGLLNTVLSVFGIPKQQWIFDESSAVPSLIFMHLWSSGSGALIILAGLKDVPKHLYEAVEIDGGNWLHKFFFVSLPMITPVIFFNLIMGFIGSLQAFTQAYVMTSGGPNNATLFYAYFIYREAFVNNNFGYACALAWILFWIIAVLTAFIFKSSKGWVFYGGK
ncbi:carbohydrate ABC transporter permease [Paenibacillus humicola]|uniref:carbohydrate ABC transporter permease n=1 Tax=Paenibacillus humicola TaxID=3110540 RepID=UPI00237AC237|nr:sugar ABC transporter permease [Paenibacillus humicola]